MPRMKTPIDLIIGQNISRMRIIAGMSQKQLGQACEITFQQIQKYESGFNRVSASKLYRLAEVLGVSVTDFYQGVHLQESASKDLLPLLRDLNALDPDTRGSIIKAFRSVLAVLK